jgi:glycosyltransferase involved in cell wall biosynthesis
MMQARVLMRIAHVVSTFPPYKGGMGNVARELAERTAARGQAVAVVTPRKGTRYVEVRDVRFEMHPVRPFLSFGNAAWCPSILRDLENIRPDVVHLHWPFIGGIAPVLRWRRGGSSRRLVVQYHMDLLASGWRWPLFWAYPQWALPRMLAAADRVVVSSLDYAQHGALAPYVQKLGDRIMEIPLGVDVERFAPYLHPPAPPLPQGGGEMVGFSPSTAVEGEREGVGTLQQYPADYIAEAIDQTRGWFYTLLAVATVLGKEAPYKNVVSLGHLLDAKGQKMSKSKGNVVSPWDMIEKYGADVVRWYMCAINQPWDPKLFDEADLKTMGNKPFGTLLNLLSFWGLHGGGVAAAWSDAHPLDRWLRTRVAVVRAEVTKRLDAYEITEAARTIADLVDDISTWWLRRSRERLKENNPNACGTFAAAIRSIAMLLAPFAPFTAEHAWRTLRAGGVLGADAPESVHLAMWDVGVPVSDSSAEDLIAQMDAVRRCCSLALEARARAGIPVRQALGVLRVRDVALASSEELRPLICEEVNVKLIVIDATITEEVALDTTITPELKREGMIRELTRAVNDVRKRIGLAPSDRIQVTYECPDAELAAAITEHHDEVLRATHAAAFQATDVSTTSPDAPMHHEVLTIAGVALTLDVTRAS